MQQRRFTRVNKNERKDESVVQRKERGRERKWTGKLWKRRKKRRRRRWPRNNGNRYSRYREVTWTVCCRQSEACCRWNSRYSNCQRAYRSRVNSWAALWRVINRGSDDRCCCPRASPADRGNYPGLHTAAFHRPVSRNRRVDDSTTRTTTKSTRTSRQHRSSVLRVSWIPGRRANSWNLRQPNWNSVECTRPGAEQGSAVHPRCRSAVSARPEDASPENSCLVSIEFAASCCLGRLDSPEVTNIPIISIEYFHRILY